MTSPRKRPADKDVAEVCLLSLFDSTAREI
ncbi:unnamed protein product [Kuraishia capsulata CBS 1993]|uniref:Uncharacterized protein n=1 Tax=Kuraishia capsulata CBS 1993 TaxID=1382522 RepID=W6MV94_9ASCO|nr:uncharacterized protein KUCA_T00002121001 [Kuraishia capsulata CBS 1993]CDK26150.1 unnamed protein product [Kuraishia capsulata CBS 1993]